MSTIFCPGLSEKTKNVHFRENKGQTTKANIQNINLNFGHRNSAPVPKMKILQCTHFANYEKFEIWPKKCISELLFDFNGKICPKFEISWSIHTIWTPNKAVIWQRLPIQNRNKPAFSKKKENRKAEEDQRNNVLLLILKLSRFQSQKTMKFKLFSKQGTLEVSFQI